ncbi:hypothetical protein ACW7G2_13270 [Luteimonas sp. A277]
MPGYERRTDSLARDHDWYAKPFMRYTVKKEPPTVWNVLDGTQVDFSSWTFADHFDVVMKLLAKAGADSELVTQLCKENQDPRKILRSP